MTASGDEIVLVGISTRSCATSAIRAGLAPLCLDSYADTDLRRIAVVHRIHPRDFPKAVRRWSRRWAGIPRILGGGMENRPSLVDRIRTTGPLLGPSGKTLRAVRDVSLVDRVLTAAGFPLPDWTDRADRASTDGNWLVKPRNSSGGLGIRPFRGGTLPRTAYLQRFVPGEVEAASFLATRRETILLGRSRQLIGRFGSPAPYAWTGAIGPLETPAPWRSSLERIGEAIRMAFGLRGLFGVDFVRTGETIVPLEINPRYPASLETLEISRNRSAVAWHVRSFDDRAESFDFGSDGGLVGKAVLWADRPLRIRQDAKYPPVSIEEPKMADLPQPGRRLRPGEPIATVFARGANPSAVSDALDEHVRRFRATFVISLRFDEDGLRRR